MNATMTEALAQFAIETRTAEVPDAALEAAQNALIDTVGVALAGSLEPVGAIALRWTRELGARPQVAVWGQGVATSPAEAAFANAVCSHALDFDDSHPGARGHASATLVPVAVVSGELTGACGKEVLAAYALALEIAGKIGRALGPGHLARGWHPTATVGIFAATAAAGRLMGLDVFGLRRAWGIAASQMGGLVRNFGTMTKPFHAGHAARCGVLSAWMARSGFTSDDRILDGKGGVLETYRGGDGEPPEALLGALGNPWEVLDPGNYVKRWPCCYSNHRALGGLLALIEEHAIGTGEIGEISIGFLPGGDAALVSRDPQTGLEGKFSIEYVAAAMLIDKALGLETFTDAMVQRPPVREFMRKVRRHAIPDDRIYSGIAGYNDIVLTTARGRFERRVDRVPGSPAWPMTAGDRARKFMDCAGRVLRAPGAARLLELCERCRTLPDMRELVQAAIPPASPLATAQQAVSPPSRTNV